MKSLIFTLYALLSALCYVGSTLGMKYYDRLGILKSAAIIIPFLCAAVFFEILALRTERFGLILVLILGLESAMGLVLSWGWFSESYSTREIVGFAFIIIGIGLLKF